MREHRLPKVSAIKFCILFLCLLVACGSKPTISNSTITPENLSDPGIKTTVPAFGTPETVGTEIPAASTSPVNTQTGNTLDSVEAAPQTPPASPEIARPRYAIEIDLDYWQHQARIQEKIQYTNNTQDTINNLVLMVDSLYFSGAFNLISISWEDQQPVSDVVQEKGWLKFPLRKPLLPNETIHLALVYELILPSPTPGSETRPIPFGYTEKQTNLVDWYPFVPPYISGKGWLVQPAGYYGEHLAYDMADFEVWLELTGDPENLIVAASAPQEKEAGVYHYRLANARNFALSVSPYYQIQTQQAGNVTIASYYFPVHASAGQAVLQTTAEAVVIYSRLFGDYPYPMLSAVQADFLDGMEYSGLFFLSNGFYNLYTGNTGSFLTTIAAHETAHQWWYGLVGNDQANEPWLDEALSTYSERLYFENSHPEDLAWWWDYRINYYQPDGWVDDSIYNPHGELEAYRSYRDAVYLNGGLFLEKLRKAMGDQLFIAFLKAYLSKYSGKIATGKDFFDLLHNYVPDLEHELELLEKEFFLLPHR